MQPRAVASALEKLVQVDPGHRHQRRVEHRRTGPLELARFRVDLVRQRDVPHRAVEPRRQRLLVHRVGIGVEQGDRDGVDAERGERLGDADGLVVAERDADTAVAVDPLAHLES